MPGNILRLLQKKDKYVSGEKISSELGITRAAVWKKINMLRLKGFIIEALPSKGYRLIRSPDLSVDEIDAQVRGEYWKKILLYESVDSTNERATSLSIKDGNDSGTVIIADRQEKGRGRLGRTWISPPGVNIYMSIILKPEIEPKDATLLTVLASVACTVALRKTSGIKVSIKWPNDLMFSEKKIGGILTEVRSEPDKIKIAIVGIGINVNIEKKDFPSEIRSIATSIKAETGEFHSRSRLIIQILKEIEGWHMTFKKSGRRVLLKKCRQLSSTIGRKVRVTIGEKTVSGLAEDIDDEGMLILTLQSGGSKRISSGDVAYLR
jgi:BirA family biotin operon repressor/biotin-[acetyl-CoA-carboxylase] ligase